MFLQSPCALAGGSVGFCHVGQEPMIDNLMVSRGSGITVKADGTIEGMLVRFGSPDAADTDGEFFTAKTDFGFDGREEMETALYYHHGLDPTVGLARIGTGTLKMVKGGVFFRGQL